MSDLGDIQKVFIDRCHELCSMVSAELQQDLLTIEATDSHHRNGTMASKTTVSIDTYALQDQLQSS